VQYAATPTQIVVSNSPLFSGNYITETVEVTNDQYFSIRNSLTCVHPYIALCSAVYLPATHESYKRRQKSKIQFLVFIFGNFCCSIAYVAKKTLRACVSYLPRHNIESIEPHRYVKQSEQNKVTYFS
jgi:hypothetical protein